MHCVNCDRLLSDFEATRKHAVTFKFLDLCKVCFEDVKTIIPTIDRRELMTEQEFDEAFDRGDLDCDFAMFISEHYDAWAKHQMLSYWEDPDAYEAFKERMVKNVSL